LTENLGPKLRVQYCLLKSGANVQPGETGAGMTDFSNGPEFIIWLQAMNAVGSTVAIQSVRFMI
jgi:hypothetical protein